MVSLRLMRWLRLMGWLRWVGGNVDFDRINRMDRIRGKKFTQRRNDAMATVVLGWIQSKAERF